MLKKFSISGMNRDKKNSKTINNKINKENKDCKESSNKHVLNTLLNLGKIIFNEKL